MKLQSRRGPAGGALTPESSGRAEGKHLMQEQCDGSKAVAPELLPAWRAKRREHPAFTRGTTQKGP